MHMTEYKIADVKKAIALCIDVILEKKEDLTEIDSRNGDGDLGVSMEKGSMALRLNMSEYRDESIGLMLMKGGMAFNKAAPSTMGTLISMALVTLGREWKEKMFVTDEDVVKVPRIMADSISKQGKAQVGNKTVLDALYPFADSLESSFTETGNLLTSLNKATEAARAGMETTKGMQAKVGRARWLGERSMAAPDGGAMLCVYIVERLAQQATDRSLTADDNQLCVGDVG